MTHPLPSEYRFGKVIGRAVHAIADSAADEDHLPEARPAVGRVRFTPKTSIRKAVNDYSAFVLKSTVHADLDELGRIIDAEGRLGIWLVTGLYTVAWEVDGSIPPFEIEVTDAHTEESPLDLVTAAPPQPGPGITLQTVIVPAGAAPGQVLGWTVDGLAWTDPEVAGDVGPEVIAARDAAVSAAGSAQASATAASLSALDAEGSATSAATSASTASAAVGSIGTSVADAEAAATQAGTARDAAVTAQGAAETARDEAVQAAQQAGGLPTGSVPIFQTLADAQAWEAAHPGSSALYIVEGSTDPGPVTGQAPTDFKYQWLGTSATPASWTDSKSGVTLTKAGTEATEVSGGVVSWPVVTEGTRANAYYGPAALTLTVPPTITLVARAVAGNFQIVLGSGSTYLTLPNGSGTNFTISNNPGGLAARFDEWQVYTARVDGARVTVGTTTGTVSNLSETWWEGMAGEFSIGRVGAQFAFMGALREVRIYDRSLTDDEVYYLHEELADQYGITL